MSYLTERASYLKGLAEGLGIDDKTNEGKLLSAILDIIEEMADEISLIEERQDDMADMVSDIAELDGEEDEDDDEEDLDYFEIQCEKCGNIIYLDEDLLETEEDIKCPVCGEIIQIEIDDCCCEDGCDCDDCNCD